MKIQIEEQKREDDLRRWYVLSTQWRQEKLALENLQRQGFEAYLPLHLVEVKPKGQPARTISLPLFPRYLFCQVDLGVTGWRSIYGTRGVQGVLPCETHASRVLARLVADIQRREVQGLVALTPAQLPCRWAPGDRVSYGVVREAIFCERVDDRRCAILVSLLGRDSRQIVDLADLE
jgi:transcriptional antiterminator RfaH